MPGQLLSERFAAGYKAGASSDISKPLVGTEMLLFERVAETERSEKMRVGKLSDLLTDLGFELSTIDDEITVLLVGGGTATLKIESGLITQVRYGTGAVDDPYLVYTAADLDAVRDDLDAYYEQKADIDLAGYANWVPIGNASTKFTGSYDGGEFKITNLVIYSTATYTGLFGYVSGATIENLTIENGAVESTVSLTAMLAGQADGSTITNCHTSGSVISGGSAGGLVASNSSDISLCSSTCSIVGVGAAVGIGGLVGATGAGTITKSFATGAISGTGMCGGLAGCVIGDAMTAQLTDCYATGEVSGTGTSNGGLVGTSSDGVITNCYSVGLVGDEATSEGGLVGALDDVDGTVVTSCYWDKTINSGLSTPDPAGVVGVTTANMKKQATFVNWDFVTPNTWDIVEDTSYPTLVA